ncbi:MAG: (2Fe-2S)-binding protein [Chloroflexi bacterium]|nr:(2Fe-2S)-binding protein [Chloroflexota bacterium]
MRIDGARDGPAIERGEPVTIEVNGEPLQAWAGETIATALLAHGRRTLRWTRGGKPRGLFCAMGVCYDCLVTVGGQGTVRACLVPVEPGMRVTLSPRPTAGTSANA